MTDNEVRSRSVETLLVQTKVGYDGVNGCVVSEDSDNTSETRTVATLSDSGTVISKSNASAQRLDDDSLSKLDFSFLHDGILFDREDQQKELLSIYHQQIMIPKTKDNESLGSFAHYDGLATQSMKIFGIPDSTSSPAEREKTKRNQAARTNGLGYVAQIPTKKQRRSVSDGNSILRQARESKRRTSSITDKSLDGISYYSFRSQSLISSGLSYLKHKDFVIVSGLSGTGKTILVEQTLKSTVREHGGYFLYGKLDQAQQTTNNENNSQWKRVIPQRPYAPFVTAIQQFVHELTNADKKNVQTEIRKLITSALTPGDIDLLLGTFVSLTDLIYPNKKNKTDSHGSYSKDKNIPDSKGKDSRRSISATKVNGTDSQRQLARVVRKFFYTICDPQQRPVVLLIDDLQWADPGTLILLKALLSQIEDDHDNEDVSLGKREVPGLLLVGTCRHNEVDVEDELAGVLRSLEDDENVIIHQIEVSNLSREVCGELFARVLGVPPTDYTPDLEESLKPIVDIAFEQTQGNAFYFLQFIRSLIEEGILQVKEGPSLPGPNENSIQSGLRSESRDSVTSRGWRWSEDSIRESTNSNCDAVSILAHQIKRLPQVAQKSISIASCLGSEFSMALFQNAMLSLEAIESNSKSEEALTDTDLMQILALLIKKDLIRIVSASGNFRFAHDKVQQAALSLISDSEKDLFRVNLGRRLQSWKQQASMKSTQSYPSQRLEEGRTLFLIANLFSSGITSRIISDQQELAMVSRIMLEAGELAVAMSEFFTAASYLELGMQCLTRKHDGVKNSHWKSDYCFSLAIYSTAAEVEYCIANFERMDELIKEILINANCFYDKMRAYATMIYSLGSRMRLFEAIAQGFSLLEILEERFPPKRNKTLLLLDLLKTKQMAKHFNGDLRGLQLMGDKNKEAAMQIMNLIFPYCLMITHPLCPFVICRMVQLSIRHGFTATSATGFSGYGFLLSSIGDFRGGHKNGKIALRLIENFGATQLRSRVYVMYYGFICNWNTQLKLNLASIMEGHKLGLSSGDIESAMMNATMYSANLFHAGQPLEEMHAEIYKLYELTRFFRQKSFRALIAPILQQIMNLRASVECNWTVPWILSGDACDEHDLIAEAKESNNAMCLSQFYYRKLWMAYVFHEYNVAYKMAKKDRVTMRSSTATFLFFSHYFFEGMTCIALLQTSSRSFQSRLKYLRSARKCLKVMKKYSNHCKLNCLNKVLLLEAEIKQASRGDLKSALGLYEQSASIAHEEGLMHERALAYERAGLAIQWHRRRSKKRSARDEAYRERAQEYYNLAMSLYWDWGAMAKVEHMSSAEIFEEFSEHRRMEK